MKKKVRKNPVAKVTVYGLGAMTVDQRVRFGNWLDKLALNVTECAKDYPKGRFTARYFKR